MKAYEKHIKDSKVRLATYFVLLPSTVFMSMFCTHENLTFASNYFSFLTGSGLVLMLDEYNFLKGVNRLRK